MSDEKAIRKLSQIEFDADLTFKTDKRLKQSVSKQFASNSAVKNISFQPQQKNSKQINPSFQNEKINQNNRIIQDMLNENKKQTISISGGSQTIEKLQIQLKQTQIQQTAIQQKIQVHQNIGEDETKYVSQKEDPQLFNIQVNHDQKEEGQKSEFLSVKNDKNLCSSLTQSPLANKTKEQNKRQSVQNPNTSPKKNTQSVSFLQIAAKLKKNDLKFNQLPNQQTNNYISLSQNNLAQNTQIKSEDAYKINPPKSSTVSRRQNNGTNLISGQSLRDIKTTDKFHANFRITDKMNLTSRNLSTNYINTSSNNQKIYPPLLGNYSQQFFNQICSPQNDIDESSKQKSPYYPLTNDANKQNNSKQFLFKPSSIAKIAIDQDQTSSQLFSTPVQGSNNQKQIQGKQRTMQQLDLSQVTNQINSQADLVSTFRSTQQNQIGINTLTSIGHNIETMTSQSKKFAQSFSQLTKIVQQNSPEKSPSQSTKLFLKLQKNDSKQIDLNQKKNLNQEVLLSTKYEAALKKEINSAFSDAPSSRQDVINMQKWIQLELNQIQKMNSQKKIDHLSSLIELSYQELIRQISFECFERGELLKTVVAYKVLAYTEQIQQQKQNFDQFKKQSEDKFLQSHQIYEGIFAKKESEILKLNEQLEDIKKKLVQSLKQMEEQLASDKQIRQQLTKFKELATYMKHKENESKLENNKLRQKISRAHIKKGQEKSSVEQHDNLKFIHINHLEQNQITSLSHNSSINSDLFEIDENQQSERVINIGVGGVNESIDKLNCVRFTNPDDVKKYEVIQTQTGASLLLFNDMNEMGIQTDLQDLIDEEYDQILQNKYVFDQFVYKIENMEAQVEYLKQREITLIEQIESLKAERSSVPDSYGAHHSQNQIYQFNQPLSLQISPPHSRLSGQDFEIPSLTSLTPNRKKKFDEIDTVLTEKYKNIMQKLNLDSKNVSVSVSSSESEDEDDIDSPVPITKDEKAAKRAKRQKLIKAVQNKTNMRQLGEKINQVESLFNDLGRQIVEKVKKNKYHKFRNFMPLPTLLKQINLVYLDRMKMINENPRIKEQECSNFTYYFLTKLYGFKKIVDQKFIIFVLSIKKYMNVLRVNIFARFINLLDNRTANFSLDECNKYIEVLNYVFNISTVGQMPSPYENDSKYMVPFIRAMAFVGNFADTRMTFDENNEFRKEIESLKENDQKGIHTAGIIDFDVFLNKMLAKYRQLVNRAKTYVINAFAASDLDGNGVCNLDEFLILNRHIEVDLYDEDVLSQIFMENADKVIEGEQNLTFDKFAVVCVDYNLFSDEAQDKFLGIRHKREIDFKIQELQTEWVFRKRELKTIFEQLNLISQESKKKWLLIIDVLHEKLKNVSQGEQKPLLIAYKILQNESRTLLSLEEEVKRDEELLNQYQEKALKDQKDQQISFLMLESNGLSPSGSLSSPHRHKKKSSNGSQTGLQQMLMIPLTQSSVQQNGQKKMSQYANQVPTSNANISQIFTFNSNTPSLTNTTSIITPTAQRNSVSNTHLNPPTTNSIEQNLKDANFMELMLQKLKNVHNKEKYLVNILLKNGIDEPSESDITQIQNIIIALDQQNPESQQTAKQQFFQFLMKQINSNSKKTSNSQTLIQ